MRSKNSRGMLPLLPKAHWQTDGTGIFKALGQLAIASSLTTCAVRSNGGSGTQYGIDEAALLGRQITEFVFPDGGEGSLRVLNGRYSVKFNRYSRVIDIDIDKAVSVKFKSTALVDGFSLVILEESEANCAKMIHVLAVRGWEVRVWDLGNCRSEPQTSISSNEAYFDVRDGSMITRYIFKHGQGTCKRRHRDHELHPASIFMQRQSRGRRRDQHRRRCCPVQALDTLFRPKNAGLVRRHERPKH